MAIDETVIFRSSRGEVWRSPATGNYGTMNAGHALCCDMADEIDRLRAAVRAANEVIKATGVDRDAVCDAWQAAYAAVKDGL